MKRLHAWRSNKKGEFNVPIYHEGPCWAIIGEEITSQFKFIGYLFDLNHWFEKFTREYEGKGIKEQK